VQKLANNLLDRWGKKKSLVLDPEPFPHSPEFGAQLLAVNFEICSPFLMQ
jgi:hypothetical protein